MSPTRRPATPLLRVDDLTIEYRARRRTTRAVKEVSLEIAPGETLGLVGESGSGKTTVGRAILGLTPVTSGRIVFDNADITHAGRSERRRLSRDIQVVFQDPYSSLNPAMDVGAILAEPLQATGVPRLVARGRVAGLLERVGLPADAQHRLPREFSGGQRQRIAIARALALEPRLVVCDEPVSALDLTTQARILDLLLDIQLTTGVAYLFVSHDLDVIRHLSHRVAVMYHGEVVEQGGVDPVTTAPSHLYTRRLLAASPVAEVDEQAIRRAAWRALEPLTRRGEPR